MNKLQHTPNFDVMNFPVVSQIFRYELISEDEKQYEIFRQVSSSLPFRCHCRNIITRGIPRTQPKYFVIEKRLNIAILG